ncbi:MAG: HlyD family efflux transporter periplasmic adaptor subunit [Anaerolineaceae bacterium]|nr:HlyD family efflux transporter periplasmic adaptor subunit [Anaerolineaceae bacterium]
MKFIHLLRACFLLSLFFLLAACGMMPTPSPTPAVPAPVDQVDDSRVSALAKVVPAQWSKLVFSGSAVAIDVQVNVGDQVKEGQLLVSSDETALILGVRQAEAGYKRAQLALQQLTDLPAPEAVAAARASLSAAEANLDQLERSGAREINQDAGQAQVDSAQQALDALLAGATQQQLDAAQADLDAAKAALVQANSALDAAQIVAPYDGTIVDIYARDGELFAPGQAVVLLADLSSLQVETTDLSEVDAARIQIGDPVVVSFDALPDVSITGSIIRIAEQASPGSAVNFTTVIRLDQIPAGLRWGMTAFVEIQAK